MARLLRWNPVNEMFRNTFLWFRLYIVCLFTNLFFFVISIIDLVYIFYLFIYIDLIKVCWWSCEHWRWEHAWTVIMRKMEIDLSYHWQVYVYIQNRTSILFILCWESYSGNMVLHRQNFYFNFLVMKTFISRFQLFCIFF